MKKFLTAVMLIAFSFVLNAQDDAMKAWMESIQPGPMHKMMAKMVGDWNTVMKMVDPMSGQEMNSEGTAKFELMLGGRYMKSVHNSNMMGMPFEGVGIDAYDNIAKEFVSIWIDNMGTGIMVLKGQYDEKTNLLNFTGEGLDPMSGQTVKYRSVSKWVNDDLTVFDMFITSGGQEMKMFTMEYKRKK
ncbi:MAG: DUF1579 domain-containing protein [Ignavibacteria bacterium]|nr:DUF1579 domain-containing protein [Ignavibacteria bacterium]